MKRAARILTGALVASLAGGLDEVAAQEAAAEAPARLVAGFLDGAKASLRSPGDLPALGTRLRPLLVDLDLAVSKLQSLPERRQALGRARDALSDGLAAILGEATARPAVEDLVKEAFRLHRNRRISSLETSLICWCKEEDWTRTLAGCPEGCAMEQKMLIGAWLDEGATNDEIIERMVQHPRGGPRVRAAPEAMRRRSTTAPVPESRDDVVGDQIERELKEMES
jgi:hypothetical protein